MAASDAKPFPLKNTAYRVTFPIFDADGDLVTGASSLDSEVSKDGGTFADCTNEATEIATSSGIYYLDLTADEMNADTVFIIVKTSTSGAKTTPIALYPVEAGDIIVNVVQVSGDTTAADNLESYCDGTTPQPVDVTAWKGSVAPAMTGDAYARLGAPAGASVSADVAAVKSDSGAIKTKTDYLPSAAAGANGGVPTVDANNAVKVQSGTGANQISLSSGAVALQANQDIRNVSGNVAGSVGSVAAGGISAASIATGAVDADALATDAVNELVAALLAFPANKLYTDSNGYVIAQGVAAGGIASTAFAAGALNANALAADAVDEILDEVVEGTLTVRQVLRLLLAALAGKTAGSGTTSVTFRDNGDAKDRIAATLDGSGNRTAVTLDAS